MAEAGAIDSLQIEIEASSKSAVTQVNNLAKALRNLKDATSGSLNIGNFKKELGKLGNNEYTKIEKLAQALQGLKNVKLDGKIGNSMLKIADACDLIEQQHIDKLTKFGTALQTIKSISAKGYDKLPASVLNISAAVDSITDDSIARISRLTVALSRLRGVDLSGLGAVLRAQNEAYRMGSRQSGAGGNSNGAQNSGQQNQGGQSGSGQNGSDKQIQQTLLLKKNISLIAAEWTKVGQAIANAIPAPLRLVLRILGGIVKAVWNVAKGIAKWAFNTALNAIKRIASGIKSIVSGVANFGKNLAKNWYENSAIKKVADEFERIQKIISTFGRIAFYRAVRSALKYVTDALKEGTENAYWFSKEFGDATAYIAQAYDQISSSNFKMSNQLGAAWSTLIATIEPILIRIIELVTRAADAITQFFAVLGGKTVYMKAIDYSKDWADATESGSQAAKEWKNQLMGFDEINRLEAPSDNGSGGGGSGAKDYENMFEESEVGGIFKEIRDLIESNQWGELGTLLGNKFNELVNAFDWAGWGKKIGKGIQYGIDLGFNFFNTADFQNIGSRFAEFINNIGDGINFEQLGRLTRKIRLALWNVLYGAVTTLDWKAWAVRISDYIIGSLNELADWLAGLDPQKIAQAIKDFFGNIKYEGIRDSFVNVISTAWEKAIELKDAIFDDKTKEKVKNALTEFFGGLTWNDISSTISEKIKGVWDLIHQKYDEWFPPEKREKLSEKIKGWFYDAISKIDFAAIHNILSYKLDTAVFGEKWAQKWWGTGDYAGSEYIKGMIWGTDSESANIRRTNAEILADIKKADELFGNDIQSEVQTTLSGINADVSREVGSMSSDVQTELGNVQNSTFLLTGAMQEMSGLGISAVANMDGGIAQHGFSIVNTLRGIRDWAVETWQWLGNVIRGQNMVAQGTTISGNHGGSRLSGTFATGGFPEDGLFFANHGELVGKFSNGKTAVANNEQITQGISAAVYNAFMEAFIDSGSGNRGEREVNIYLDGKQIAQTTTKYQKQYARAMG